MACYRALSSMGYPGPGKPLGALKEVLWCLPGRSPEPGEEIYMGKGEPLHQISGY